MKRRIFTTIFFTVTVLASSLSCTKFLDIKPYGKTIPETPEESRLWFIPISKTSMRGRTFSGARRTTPSTLR